MLLCWPLVAPAGEAVGLRLVPLAAAPAVVAGQSTPAAGTTPAPRHASAPATVADHQWLRASAANHGWYALQLVRDWHGDSPPLLVIDGNTRARLTVYLPPDYRPQSNTIYSTGLDPTFSHRAVVYRLPAGLRASQPIYLELGGAPQTQPIGLRVADTRSYRIGDLRHIRASTMFTGVQVAMVLVILCFWVVLRDRMFLYFIIYVAAQIVYGLAASGELFASPLGPWLSPFGYRTGQCAATLAAAFSIWFILEFAALPGYTRRLAAWLGALRWPLLLLAALVWIRAMRPDTWLPNTVNLLLLASTGLALAASWLAWRHGNRQAGFFLLSWVPLLTLVVAKVVQLVFGLPLPTWLEYGLPASMAYAAVIITVGLADRTLQVRRERDHATRMAQFDPLTGVMNRRASVAHLETAWQAGGRSPAPLAVLFLDIDHFKQVNDTRGHAAGDACLRALVEAVRAELGTDDTIGRWGGEEFLIVLNGPSALLARQMAERIVARAAGLRVSMGEVPVTFTVSIGVAVRDATTASVEALVEHADAAQYRAKAEGRNRSVVFEGATARALAGARAP